MMNVIGGACACVRACVCVFPVRFWLAESEKV